MTPLMKFHTSAATGLKSNQFNRKRDFDLAEIIKKRISNFVGWKRFAKSFLKQTEYIHSTFDVGRSMLDVHQFLFRLDRPFFWPAAGLTPDT
jgi:hypothetical protein